MQLSPLGIIAEECLTQIPHHHNTTELWNYVIMPNHIHMVINVVARNFAPARAMSHKLGCLKPPMHGKPCEDFHHNSMLAKIIGSFKAAVTREARIQGIAPAGVLWQRSYHEHIIRTQRSFDYIMEYIDNNEENWSNDCFTD